MNRRPGTRPDVAAKNRATANPDAPTRHPLRVTWKSMVARCHSETSKDFARYGARGIAVCERWRASFEAFVADMGPRPSALHSIDRIDNARGYEPSNCAWRTGREQARNRRSSRFIEAFGRSQTLVEWARETGISRALISHRLRAGWSVEESLTVAPSKSANSRHHRSTKEVCT